MNAEHEPNAFDRVKQAAQDKVVDFATEKAKRAAENVSVAGLTKLAEGVKEAGLQEEWDQIVAEGREEEVLGLKEGLMEKLFDFSKRVLAGPLQLAMIPNDLRSTFWKGLILTGMIRADQGLVDRINSSDRFNEQAAKWFLKAASFALPTMEPAEEALKVVVMGKEGARAVAEKIRVQVEKGQKEPDQSLDHFHDDEVGAAGLEEKKAA